ncbi:uncharacterized protein LOC132270092 [Cornus florida]|uniref:uncharacterized protein LOC132270092 n=1 Tax=Cornus florida TaxID=4283 RepID=UPI0028A0A706|nr:uncharacterized protein LOC132270092 [Cornus florida]
MVDPVGRSGGIVIWWMDAVNLQAIKHNRFSITAVVSRDTQQPWTLSIVYTSTVDSTRAMQWKYLEHRSQFWPGWWVLVGDFNDILYASKKSGGVSKQGWRLRNFNSLMARCNSLDIGFKGYPFTWNNHRDGPANIQEMLDRALATQEWCSAFPHAKLSNLPVAGSDHHALLLELHPLFSLTKRQFHFDARWNLDNKYAKIIANNW